MPTFAIPFPPSIFPVKQSYIGSFPATTCISLLTTLFHIILDFIDSPALRSNVQRALSRGENYHQLRRAVSYANFGKLRFKTEHEQQIWSECSRLITN
jgi:TnpA family transposase